MGSRAGLIAPDETTFAYLKGREYAPKGAEWDKAVEEWRKLKSDPDAVFDKEVTYRAEDIAPRITYGTNPGAGIAVDECIPTLEQIAEEDRGQFLSMLDYMQFQPGQKLEGTPVDYSCSNTLHHYCLFFDKLFSVFDNILRQISDFFLRQVF